MTKCIFCGLHKHVCKGGWLFNKLERDTFKANAIKLSCSSTIQHPEGIYHVTGVESTASLEAFPQTAPGNQAATHIWIALYPNGIASRDEELARKKQQSMHYYSFPQILNSARTTTRLNNESKVRQASFSVNKCGFSMPQTIQTEILTWRSI